MLAASTSETANNFYDSRKMAVGLSCKFTKLSQCCRKNSYSHPYDKEEKNVRLSHKCLTMFVRSSCEKGQYPKPLKIVRNHMSPLRLSWGCLTAAVQRAKIAKNRRNNMYVENLTYDTATTVRRCKFVGLSCGYRTDFCDYCQKDNRI